MKTLYITPSVEILELSAENMIATSGVNGNNGIGYGGVDEDGTSVPSSNGHRGSWGNLWE